MRVGRHMAIYEAHHIYAIDSRDPYPMTAMTDLPYFPRTELTDSFIKMAESGLVTGFSMFAPRRQGKTWFVTRELLPAFEARGWNVRYVDLWRGRLHPEESLVEFLEEGGPSNSLHAFTKSIRKVKFKALVAGSGGEVEMAKDETTPRALERRLEQALAALVKNRRRCLLVIDEFQVLAGAKRVEFVSALRAALQAYQGRILPLFTGSSRTALNSMFRSAGAPLFQSAFTMPFPALGRDFIVDRTKVLRERAPKLKIPVQPLFDLFVKVGKSPFHVNGMIGQALLKNTANVPEIYELWMEAVAGDEDYQQQLKALKPLQLATLLALAPWPRDGVVKPGMFSDVMRSAIRKIVPREDVSIARVQTVVNRLQSLQLISSEASAGDYDIEDVALKAFLLKAFPAETAVK